MYVHTLQTFFPSFSDTKFCKSILLPTEDTLKKALQSTFINAKSDTALDGTNRIDLCCRTLHKCDALKRHELNHTNLWPMWHCECVRSFHTCLNNLNTTLSNEFAFIHSVNTTKCFSNDHPIVKCKRLQQYSDSSKLFKSSNLDELEKHFKRCIKYELNLNQREELQIFDVPYRNVYYEETTVSGKSLRTKKNI